MFPIRDDQPRYSVPVVNYFVIALNLLVYFCFEVPAQMQGQRAFDVLVLHFGLIPEHFTRAISGSTHYTIPGTLLTILTSMFLHGDLFHILGNLWFLWIFGDNIEDYLGHFPYLLFYLLCGIAAALTDIALDPSSQLPTIGASGAIAGVMGAYILLYPRAKVLTWVVFIFFWWIPSWFFLGYWFLIQFIAGYQMLAIQTATAGGVAWWAHIGGFIWGALIALVLQPVRRGPMVETA